MLVGLVIGAAFLAFALLHWDAYTVALAVSLALVAACSTATLTAMALPWLLSRLGGDPAFGSGPLATVVQDLLSITIYLVICTRMVSWVAIGELSSGERVYDGPDLHDRAADS